MDYTLNRPNFLGSEVGLVLKTVGLDAVTNSTLARDEVVVGGLTRKVIPAGSYVEVGSLKGFVFQDIDVTGTTAETQKPAPLMIAGYYIDANLPKSVSTQAEDLATQNLIAIEDPAPVRTTSSVEFDA